MRSLVVKVRVLTGLVAVADFVFGATFVTFMGQRGLEAAMIGGLLALPAVTALLLDTPSGAWGDRFGHKRLVSGGLLVWGVGLVVFSLAASPAVFAVAILLWTAGLALHSGASTALLVNTLNAHGAAEHGDTAIRGTETIRWTAAAAGAILVALGGRAATDGLAIALAGALLVAAAVWVTFAWPDSPRRAATPIGRSILQGVRVVGSRRARMLLLFGMLTSIDLGIVILTWQPMATDIVGVEDGLLGVVLLVLSLAIAAGAGATHGTRRLPATGVLAVALTVLNIGLGAVLLGTAGAIVAYVLAEVMLGVALTTLAVWAQALFPDVIRATATSVLATATGVTLAVTNGIMGPLWGAIGLTEAVAAAAGVVLVLVAAGAAHALRRAARRRVPASAAPR
ncbi:MFS transporter [Leifsonia sp. EB34]|uniref:MFS transporter n=1 Tax=Leifsonia sp. EB34 TaxID=3156303 RepID=UPI0035162762